MNVLSVENLAKSYTDKVLFKELSFGLDSGTKTALVAGNGTGKTTLLRILAGKEAAEKGELQFRKDIKVGYLEQDPFFDNASTVFDNLFMEGNEMASVLKDYELSLENYEKDPNENNLAAFEKASNAMDLADGWDFERKISAILSGFNIHDLQKNAAALSGGERKRVALARVLISEPDFLILDEPTNHLDVNMIEWLEDYLNRSKMTVFLVTHDRYFLNNICDEILELDRGKMYRHRGNYEYFLEKKTERIEAENAEVDKARNLFRKELDWIRRQPKARTTKSKARIDSFSKLEEKVAGKRTEDKLELHVRMSRMGGKILELKNVKKAYGEKKLLDGFTYTFKKGEKVGIVGENGCGKTTFLDIITGIGAADYGKINPGETIVFGYYKQTGMVLNEDKRVIEVLKEVAEVVQLTDGTKVSISKMLELFLFPKDLHYSYVSKLSGGEKRRLFLLSVLLQNPNFLILDEPTNDLDLLTLNVLEEFLLSFPGCLIIVSHDRYFMDKLAEHLFVFEGDGKISDFPGTYSAYREKMKLAEKNGNVVKPKEKLSNNQEKSTKKLSYKDQFEYDKLGPEIEALETDKKTLEQEMLGAAQDHEKLAQLSSLHSTVIKKIEEKSDRWLEIAMKVGG